ncbi:hypothetical protein SEA_RICKMORE_44 [Gordonia phage Rickmore]|uniref:Uncharacterized protein n=1 Tax=Gordonia phage Rickmore TaxID=2507854 RepID=A0A410TB50_9CAUD|nr:hypothetical protein HWC05_gp44 [Gordonia phage Rickmore]QAU06278.1 hypothetical protein SEA_RICKMORE_44 [Gordonia phage Rickmore]
MYGLIVVICLIIISTILAKVTINAIGDILDGKHKKG